MLENDGFRRLLAARAVSVLGDGLYTVAAMWLVYDLTGSTAMTGLAGFLSRAPGVLAVLVGPLVDRARLGQVLVLSELVQALLVVVVPLAALLGWLHVGVVLVVMPLLALGNLFAGPAQNAAVPRIVADEQLVRANSVGQATTQVVDAGARAVAGAAIAVVGAVALYAVDAVTFLIAALLFLSLRVPPRDHEPDPLAPASYLAELRGGLGVLWGSTLGQMLVASLFANLLFGATLAVLPAFADTVGGPGAYGLLLAGLTAGTILGSAVASLFDRLPMGRVTVAGTAIAGALWVAGVALPGAALTGALFSLSRVPLGVYNVSASAVVQTGVPDDRLGRVSAAIGSASSLVTPAGMLAGGLAGDQFGVRTVMLASGVGTLLMTVYWFAVPSLRRFGPPSKVESGQFGGPVD